MIIAALTAAALAAQSAPSASEGASEAGSEASEANARLSLALTEAGVETASAVIAVPLAAGGAVSLGAGELSTAAGDGALAVASDFAGFSNEPLSVGDAVILPAPQDLPQIEEPEAGDRADGGR